MTTKGINMKDLTLYDLMGSDHTIFARLRKDGEVETEVWNSDDNVVFSQASHHFAWESLVSFAKMVLDQDKKIQKELF
jgi:hypothetical protein